MKEIKIKVEENLDLYISDILCWLRGYLEAKGDDFRDSDMLRNACNKLRKLNRQIKENK